MKKLLLSFFSAALFATAASAQAPMAKNPLAASSITPATYRAPKGAADIKAGGLMMPSTKRVHTLDASSGSTRNPKELSYQVTGDEMSDKNYGYLPTGFTQSALNKYGFTGWGYCIVIPKIIYNRYVGNTINKINILPYLDRYSDSKIFVGQIVPSTGDITPLWEKDVTIKGGQLNSYGCDYTISDTLTKELIIGWFAGEAQNYSSDTLTTKYGIVANAFVDQTQTGMGGYMLGTQGDGNCFLLYPLGENLDFAVSNTITAETTGNGGLNYNDAAIYNISDARGFCGKTGTMTLTVNNMGLDSLRSVTYTVKDANNVEKQYTYNTIEPIPFLGGASLDVPVKMPTTEGRTTNYLNITHVNGQVDPYTGHDENDGNFQTVAFDQAYHRTPVFEHFTSVSDLASPYTLAGIQMLCDTLGENNIVNIAVHGDYDKTIKEDPYKADTYQSLFNSMSSSVPITAVNREVSVHPYSQSLSTARYILNQPCEANIKVTGSNSLTGTKIAATVKFAIDVPDSTYGIAYVVTEDGLQTDQYNGFAYQYMINPDGAEQSFGKNPYLWPFCTAEANVVDNKYVFSKLNMDYVARYILAAGSDGTILRAAKAGQEVKMETTIRSSLIGASNKNNLRVAALLVDGYTGKIITAAQAKIGAENSSDDKLYTGINNATAATDFAQISAANGVFSVNAANASAQVYDAQGRLVASTLVDGTATIAVGGKGVYVIRVTNGAQTVTKKAIF